MSKFEKEQVFNYPKVLIAGYGIVGHHLKEEMEFAYTYDPDRDQGAMYNEPPKKEHFDFCFVCVPTPKNDFGSCDIGYVIEAIESIDADLFVIKSTVPPATTDYIANLTNKKCLFSPEFYGNTQQSDVGGFIILGGDFDSYHKVRQLYEKIKPASFKYHHVTNTEAEIIKYMENCYLGLKVTFCNQFKEIADFYNCDYDAIRDGFVLDPRVGESHTFVFDDARGYDSKCLNKDIPALIYEVKGKKVFGNTPFIMETVEKINTNYKIKGDK